MKLLLELDLIPQSTWFQNLRSILTSQQWDIIRHSVYDAAWHVCEICGETGKKHPVECHEIFSYDEGRKVRKLERMIALCPNCHACKHIGLAKIQGKYNEALCHFMKVNKLTKTQAEEYIAQAFGLWQKRSQINWKLDISYLKNYGIDIDINKLKQGKTNK